MVPDLKGDPVLFAIFSQMPSFFGFPSLFEISQRCEIKRAA
jgi:hypothetical protein